MELELKKALPSSSGYCSMKLELQRKSSHFRKKKVLSNQQVAAPRWSIVRPKNNVELVFFHWLRLLILLYYIGARATGSPKSQTDP